MLRRVSSPLGSYQRRIAGRAVPIFESGLSKRYLCAIVSEEKRHAAAKSYLSGWIGDKPQTNAESPSAQSPSPSISRSPRSLPSSLRLSGASYLLPTLRVDKRSASDTLEMIRSCLGGELESDAGSNPSYRSNHRRWMCPIALDLTAWRHDGSPHHKPQKSGYLTLLVDLLDLYGLNVIGVVGVPQELEEEAASLAPSLWAKPLSAKSNTPVSWDIQDLVQVLAVKRHLDSGRVGTLAQSMPLQTPSLELQSQLSSPLSTAQKLSEVERMLSVSSENDSGPDSQPHFTISSDSKADLQDRSVLSEGPNSSSSNTLESIDNPMDGENLSKEESAGETFGSSPVATVYRGTVRSGQQVASEAGKPLLVFGSVSSGGEVLSAGDIMVWGKLRGRAVTLASQAKIIATTMDSELICIGNTLATGDEIHEKTRNLNPALPVLVSFNPVSAELEFSSIIVP